MHAELLLTEKHHFCLRAAAGIRNGPAGQRWSKPRELRVCWSDPDQEPASRLPAKTGTKCTGAGTRSRCENLWGENFRCISSLCRPHISSQLRLSADVPSDSALQQRLRVPASLWAVVPTVLESRPPPWPVLPPSPPATSPSCLTCPPPSNTESLSKRRFNLHKGRSGCW